MAGKTPPHIRGFQSRKRPRHPYTFLPPSPTITTLAIEPPSSAPVLKGDATFFPVHLARTRQKSINHLSPLVAGDRGNPPRHAGSEAARGGRPLLYKKVLYISRCTSFGR